MTFEVVIMPSAETDLEEYADLIAESSVDRSKTWLREAFDMIYSLYEMPERFAIVAEADELGVEVRDVIHHSHRIVFRIKDEERKVEVLRVWHQARSALEATDIGADVKGSL